MSTVHGLCRLIVTKVCGFKSNSFNAIQFCANGNETECFCLEIKYGLFQIAVTLED